MREGLPSKLAAGGKLCPASKRLRKLVFRVYDGLVDVPHRKGTYCGLSESRKACWKIAEQWTYVIPDLKLRYDFVKQSRTLV